MKTIRNHKDTTQYNIRPGVTLVCLRGSWDKNQKHRPTLFVDATWFPVERAVAAKLISANRKIS